MVLAGLLVLSGCTGVNSGSGDAPTGPGTPARTGVAEQVSEGGRPDDAVRTHTRSSMEPRYHVSWPSYTGAEALNAELADQVDEQVREFLATRPSSTGTAVPELNVGWQTLADGPDLVGVRLDSYYFAGASAAESSRVTWFDRRSGEVLDPRLLVADQAELADAVAQGVQDDSVDPGVVRRAVLAGKGTREFDGAGNLRVRFDAYSVGPGSAGAVVVGLDRSQTLAVLSWVGQTARRAAQAHAWQVAAQAAQPAPDAPAVGEEAAPDDEVAPGDDTDDPGDQTDGTDGAEVQQSGPTKPVNCRRKKCVALTFDDGPVLDSARLLRSLRRLEAPATFFVLGQQARAYPALVRRAARQGHEIGVHTWDHKQLTRLRPAEVREEIRSSILEVQTLTGRRPTLLRPPYGATGPRVGRIARSLGVAQVMWDVDTLDWKVKRVAPVVREVKRSTRRGSIVLMHDIHPSSVDAVPKVVRALRRQGFTLVTVSDLLGEPQPGSVHHSGR